MINVAFYSDEKGLFGFKLSGHATVDEDDFLGKIVCSAVSSAIYLTVNTLSEIVGAKVDYFDNGSSLCAKVLSKREESFVPLAGLKLHITELSKEYKNNITIISEV